MEFMLKYKDCIASPDELHLLEGNYLLTMFNEYFDFL
jgi:hypothetical protein